MLPKLEAGRRRLSQDMAERIRDYGRILERILVDEITAKGDSLAESIQHLSETKQQDAQGRADRESDLIRQLQEFERISADLDMLRARAEGLTRDQSRNSGSAD